MSPELLIFDCDGVLIDSEPAASRVLWQSLTRAGISISEREVHERFTGSSETEVRRICIEELGTGSTDEIFGAFNEELYNEFSRSLKPMPGIEDIVAALDCARCVASNSSVERLERSLKLFSLWDAFAPNIFSAEMVARGKPAPDLFYFCAAKLGVDPGRSIVIDDSPHGIAGAVAAGMTAIGFVDPSDPRKNRARLLSQAGACEVATGAGELAALIASIFSSASQRSFDRRMHAPATA